MTDFSFPPSGVVSITANYFNILGKKHYYTQMFVVVVFIFNVFILLAIPLCYLLWFPLVVSVYFQFHSRFSSPLLLWEFFSPSTWQLSRAKRKARQSNYSCTITSIYTEEISFGCVSDCGGKDYCGHNMVCSCSCNYSRELLWWSRKTAQTYVFIMGKLEI